MLLNGHVKDYAYVKCKNEVCVEKILNKAFETDRIISITIYKNSDKLDKIYYQ